MASKWDLCRLFRRQYWLYFRLFPGSNRDFSTQFFSPSFEYSKVEEYGIRRAEELWFINRVLRYPWTKDQVESLEYIIQGRDRWVRRDVIKILRRLYARRETKQVDPRGTGKVS
ncbi:MAG: hypothetical protein ACTSPI_00950 [Candidatus Heimdallarchaeaceae archaeon]